LYSLRDGFQTVFTTEEKEELKKYLQSILNRNTPSSQSQEIQEILISNTKLTILFFSVFLMRLSTPLSMRYLN